MSGGRGHDEKKLPELQGLKPTVWIGKQGCTEATLHEIRDQVKKRKMIKVKWLRSTEPDPESIAEATGTRLVQVRGRTIVLAGRKTAGK